MKYVFIKTYRVPQFNGCDAYEYCVANDLFTTFKAGELYTFTHRSPNNHGWMTYGRLGKNVYLDDHVVRDYMEMVNDSEI